MMLVSAIVTLAEGIRFEDMTLKEALGKARLENKLVFVDCFIQTCGPCKMMAAKIFPLDECGEYFNPRFVSLKMDLEEGDNVKIADEYNVKIYPTFLILNPDGSLYYKQEGGATKSPELFLEKMCKAMKAGDCNARFAAGERDRDFMIEYVTILDGFNNVVLRQVLDSYVPSLTLSGDVDKEFIMTLLSKMNNTESSAFRHMYDRRKELSSLIGEEDAIGIFTKIYSDEYRQKKRMIRDFDKRVSDIRTLEEDGLMKTSPLRQEMMIRHVINNRIVERADDILVSIEDIGEMDVDEKCKVEALKDLGELKGILRPSDRHRVGEALESVMRSMSPEAAETLSATLRKLK